MKFKEFVNQRYFFNPWKSCSHCFMIWIRCRSIALGLKKSSFGRLWSYSSQKLQKNALVLKWLIHYIQIFDSPKVLRYFTFLTTDIFLNTFTNPAKWSNVFCLHVKLATLDPHVNSYFIFRCQLACLRESRRQLKRQRPY